MGLGSVVFRLGHTDLSIQFRGFPPYFRWITERYRDVESVQGLVQSLGASRAKANQNS